MLAFEGTFDLMDDSLVTIPPELLLQRMIKVNNALTMVLQQRIENREKMKGMDKKDPQYCDLNTERYNLEDQIDALKKKLLVIEHILYVKTAEMRMAGKAVIA